MTRQSIADSSEKNGCYRIPLTGRRGECHVPGSLDKQHQAGAAQGGNHSMQLFGRNEEIGEHKHRSHHYLTAIEPSQHTARRLPVVDRTADQRFRRDLPQIRRSGRPAL